MRRPLKARTGAGVLVAVGALLTAALHTAPATAAGPSVPTHQVARTTAEQQRILDFWPPERMRNATPLDLVTATPDQPAPTAPVAHGKPRTVPATPPDAAPHTRAFPESGGPWTGDGEVVTTSGRVFFTYQGRTASCSGNAVTSENHSTVITAGHCVKLDGAWHTDWVFVPGYHDGQRPYGSWTAAELLTTPQWEASEDVNDDIGAAVVTPVDGQRLTDVVKGQGLAFDTGYDLDVYAFGFPAADPYDGEQLVYCSGTAFRDPLLTSDHGLACDMTGGSSGGPWFTEFDETTGTGLQTSVNSFGYTLLPGQMFGPYFGAEAQQLYDTAQTA